VTLTKEPFRPIRIVDIEVSETVADLDALDRYAAVRALVRIHGVPFGYVQVNVEDGRVVGSQLVDAAMDRHRDALIRHLVVRALNEPLKDPTALLGRMLRPPTLPQPEARPLVTVAVCTRDRPTDLRLCLEGLARLRWPKLEVLVIDNAPSTNAARDLVEESFPTVRYVREPRPGLDWARNRAIAESRGEILAYADDDVVVDPGWVDALMEVFTRDPNVMAVTGLVVPYELETEAQAAFEDHRGYESGFERTWACVDRAAGERAAVKHGAVGQIGTGANMAYRRSIFAVIGGFDPALDVGTATQGGGDLEMFFRVLKEGYLLVREPRAMVYHRHRRTFSELRAQISTWGIGMYSFVTRSWRRYPDERVGFVWIVIRWLLLRNARRFLRSLRQPEVRRELLWDEMKRSFLAPSRYGRAVRRAHQIRAEFGPEPFSDEAPAPVALPRRTFRDRRVRHRIDLAGPLAPLTDVAGASETEVRVLWNGAEIGTIRIGNRGQAISPARLRDAVADDLAARILAHAGVDPDQVLRALREGPTLGRM
jgi:O-antigen biosynthesis protein